MWVGQQGHDETKPPSGQLLSECVRIAVGRTSFKQRPKEGLSDKHLQCVRCSRCLYVEVKWLQRRLVWRVQCYPPKRPKEVGGVLNKGLADSGKPVRRTELPSGVVEVRDTYPYPSPPSKLERRQPRLPCGALSWVELEPDDLLDHTSTVTGDHSNGDDEDEDDPSNIDMDTRSSNVDMGAATSRERVSVETIKSIVQQHGHSPPPYGDSDDVGAGLRQDWNEMPNSSVNGPFVTQQGGSICSKCDGKGVFWKQPVRNTRGVNQSEAFVHESAWRNCLSCDRTGFRHVVRELMVVWEVKRRSCIAFESKEDMDILAPRDSSAITPSRLKRGRRVTRKDSGKTRAQVGEPSVGVGMETLYSSDLSLPRNAIVGDAEVDPDRLNSFPPEYSTIKHLSQRITDGSTSWESGVKPKLIVRKRTCCFAIPIYQTNFLVSGESLDATVVGSNLMVRLEEWPTSCGRCTLGCLACLVLPLGLLWCLGTGCCNAGKELEGLREVALESLQWTENDNTAALKREESGPKHFSRSQDFPDNHELTERFNKSNNSLIRTFEPGVCGFSDF